MFPVELGIQKVRLISHVKCWKCFLSLFIAPATCHELVTNLRQLPQPELGLQEKSVLISPFNSSLSQTFPLLHIKLNNVFQR